MLSEILAPLLGCHQEFLLDDLRGRWSFGHEGKLEVSDDLILMAQMWLHHRLLVDEKDQLLSCVFFPCAH
jgi:hypothetical protein